MSDLTKLSSSKRTIHIGLLGFGEVGEALVTGWHEARPGVITRTFDILFEQADQRSNLERRCLALQTTCFSAATELGKGADAIFSTVTPDQILVAAKSVSAGLDARTFYLDLNSTR